MVGLGQGKRLGGKEKTGGRGQRRERGGQRNKRRGVREEMERRRKGRERRELEGNGMGCRPMVTSKSRRPWIMNVFCRVDIGLTELEQVHES